MSIRGLSLSRRRALSLSIYNENRALFPSIGVVFFGFRVSICASGMAACAVGDTRLDYTVFCGAALRWADEGVCSYSNYCL